MRYLLLFILCLIFAAAHSQQDSTTLPADGGPRIQVRKKPAKVDSSFSGTHSPRVATWRSVILPGLGQAYNKKYWKIPVIYVSAAALIYGLQWNQGNYKDFKKIYAYMTDKDSNTVATYKGREVSDAYATWALSNRNYFRKNRDLCAIGIGALYVLNIIDANVDAHLFEFNVDDDLSLRLEPRVFALNGYVYNGFGATLKF